MTETKFTTGPWFISKKFVVGPRDQEDGQSYGMIVGVADVYGDNRSADANLIAAAPDLYEASEQFDELATQQAVDSPEWRDSDSVRVVVTIGTLRAIKAARAKARGEA